LITGKACPGIEDALAEIRRGCVLRYSSVILSELRRAARTAARRQVADLYRIAAVQWAQPAEDWWRAAIVRIIGDGQDWDVAKRREFQRDALIAVTARRHGAAVVTRNRVDFALLQRKLVLPILFI
jgi:predicted nucleic acid-binding protein